MTHEFKKIVNDALEAEQKGLKTALTTVVALDGSSYRKPGVRMLIREDGKMTGAVSGGCVEKEVLKQAEEVFDKNVSKVMLYDGRYRLGCEGTLYILIEPFKVSADVIDGFRQCLRQRTSFTISSYFLKEEGTTNNARSFIDFGNQNPIPFSPDMTDSNCDDLLSFNQKMTPCFKLVIIGAEHDAVQLCTYASLTGWEVTVIASMNDPKTLEHFPGAQELLHLTPDQISSVAIDQQTAVVLMSHNYASDLKYLMQLKDSSPIYIGILGPTKRKDKLMDELITYHPEIDSDWFDLIHGPAGLNIGSITPQEIAISIVSEILLVARNEEPMLLKDKAGSIHSDVIS